MSTSHIYMYHIARNNYREVNFADGVFSANILSATFFPPSHVFTEVPRSCYHVVAALFFAMLEPGSLRSLTSEAV